MFPLWWRLFSIKCENLIWNKMHENVIVTVNNKHKNPSTNQHSFRSDAANRQNESLNSEIANPSIGGISLQALLLKPVGASMTVEACMVLPLFLFFFLNLFSIMEIIRLHGRVEFALWSAGREIALYGTTLDHFTEDEGEGIRSVGENIYARQKIMSQLGEQYVENSPMRNLFCYETATGDKDSFQISAEYQVKPLFPILGFGSFSMRNTYYGRYWRGYDASNQESTDCYYVTKEGEVYHIRPTCTYIQLSVESIARKDLENRKTSDGNEYRLCEKCKGKKEGFWVFITKEGECYHRDVNCSGLKRTVFTVKDTQGYRPCSRCANGG